MLEIEDLNLHYGQHLALDSVSVTIAPGETVVILGANGAGKSSLLKSVARLVPSDAGSQIRLDGRLLAALPAHRIVQEGIALVPEGRGVFGDLTVEENLLLGANPPRARTDEGERRAQVYDLFPKLKERRRQAVNTMSGGEQQMVAIGRALMSNPAYLMLDEPSLGLAPVMVTELFLALDRIRKSGVALLIVEQNVRVSLSIADRGYLIEAGRIVGADTAKALLNDEAVQRAFLGKTDERG
ncbi:ABC transporter ATP-binding protein [uncultured Nitratireductor sp.]|uniref:ABC transporter ATP-binding protein n=1 Tax=uncultured Nitratireductor sp. TaxID=520953 RepID=UPI0025E92152|nr:ABC transporter ATP-binding protein [uncultured Nitratireductor sp.]